MSDDLKNSINFLKKKTKEKNGFRIPENYFELLDDKIIDQKIIELPKKTPFNTPDLYFETIDNTIFDQIEFIKTQKKNVIPLNRKLIKPIPTIAAASVLFFLGYFLLVKNSNTLNFNTLTAAEIESWYENGYINTSGDELEVAFNDASINFETEIFDSIKFTEDGMEEYLENLEENTILNEIQ